jgi:glyoxylase-like metal-dependent hydrolase (beta-lactamase superfamily II)
MKVEVLTVGLFQVNCVIPGHGPATTIGEEARYNPFLTGNSYL